MATHQALDIVVVRVLEVHVSRYNVRQVNFARASLLPSVKIAAMTRTQFFSLSPSGAFEKSKYLDTSWSSFAPGHQAPNAGELRPATVLLDERLNVLEEAVDVHEPGQRGELLAVLGDEGEGGAASGPGCVVRVIFSSPWMIETSSGDWGDGRRGEEVRLLERSLGAQDADQVGLGEPRLEAVLVGNPRRERDRLEVDATNDVDVVGTRT